eukprot:1392553-Lingulodinium_polyedra.AAC.1
MPQRAIARTVADFFSHAAPLRARGHAVTPPAREQQQRARNANAMHWPTRGVRAPVPRARPRAGNRS